MAKAKDIPGLDAAISYREAAALTVAVRAQELFDQAEGVLDTSDIERVHDMRVASRRLRAVLEIYEPCFPRKLLRSVLADVKALAGALGERRDPDVQLAQLEEFAAAVKAADRPGVELFAERVRAQQGAGNEALRAALGQVEERDLRGRLAALAAAAAPSAPASAGEGDSVNGGAPADVASGPGGEAPADAASAPDAATAPREEAPATAAVAPDEAAPTPGAAAPAPAPTPPNGPAS
jgi:CHAD domain